MENHGFGINKERLLCVVEDYSTKLKEALDRFNVAFGEEINPNSPKQLKEALAEKGLKLSNTSEQTLKEEDQPLTTCILNYRSAKKQIEQAETLLKAIEEDGRIHARFEPTVLRWRQPLLRAVPLVNNRRLQVSCRLPG